VFQHIAHGARAEGRGDEGKIADEQSVVPTRDPGPFGGMSRT
jgi:hypothetical protein